MSDAEAMWSGKTDDQIADAARQLSDYTVDGERIIRAELRRRGMPDPPPTQRPIDESNSPVVSRYRDAYRVGAALVGLGNAIKVVGAILAGIIFLGSLSYGKDLLGGGAVVAVIVLAAIVGVLFWICGVIVAAQGQILRASLDTAVASSHFLTDTERADAMGLPPSVANRAGA